MPERRNGAAFDEPHATVIGGPPRQPLPAEFGTPTEPACERGAPLVDGPAQAPVGAEMIDQDDPPAGFGHTRKFVERPLRMGDRGENEWGHPRVEEGIAKTETLRIHDRQYLDIGNSLF